MTMSDDFAHRLELAMRQVAHEVGVASAYPPTPQGQRAALRQRLRTIESSREWGSDFQRTLVLRALRALDDVS